MNRLPKPTLGAGDAASALTANPDASSSVVAAEAVNSVASRIGEHASSTSIRHRRYSLDADPPPEQGCNGQGVDTRDREQERQRKAAQGMEGVFSLDPSAVIS